MGPIPTQAFLANFPLFRGVGDPALQRLAAATTRHRLRRGTRIFREGEMPDGLHALVYGRVKLLSRDAAGRLTRADIVGAGHTFGEAMLFLDKPYMLEATAATDALMLHIAKEALDQELLRTPLIARRLIGMLAQRIEWLVRERNELAIGSGGQRLVAWLLRRRELARCAGEATVTLQGTKRVLAAQLNLSAEHLSRVMRELAHAGLLHVHGREITVPDVARLRAWQLGAGQGLAIGAGDPASPNLSNRQGSRPAAATAEAA